MISKLALLQTLNPKSAVGRAASKYQWKQLFGSLDRQHNITAYIWITIAILKTQRHPRSKKLIINIHCLMLWPSLTFNATIVIQSKKITFEAQFWERKNTDLYSDQVHLLRAFFASWVSLLCRTLGISILKCIICPMFCRNDMEVFWNVTLNKHWYVHLCQSYFYFNYSPSVGIY